MSPQIRRTAALLWRLYAGLTAIQTVALWIAGFSLFDAVCHSMATLAAGGFSPHPLSLAGYQNPAAEWIIIVFMFMAGANFALQYRALSRRDVKVFTRDEELRAYTGVVIVASTAADGVPGRLALGRDSRSARRCSRSLSILTTTGFASVDFQLWNDQAKMVLLVLMFIGGCAGSAGGGPKVVRHLLLARFTLQELRRMLHPRAVLPVKLGGRVVPDERAAGRDRVLPVLPADVRRLRRHRRGAGRRHRDRYHRDGGCARQRRPGLQRRRADGATSPTCIRSAASR